MGGADILRRDSSFFLEKDDNYHLSQVNMPISIISHQSNDQLLIARTGSNAGAARIWVSSNNLIFGSEKYEEKLKIAVSDGTNDIVIPVSNWSVGRLRMGDYTIWIDNHGTLRVKKGNPSYDKDGDIVGSGFVTQIAIS